MDLTLLYWHWVVIGVALMLVEIFVGTFSIFWFGAAAIVIGIVLVVFPDLNIAVQIIAWALLSTLFAFGWFRFLKPLAVDKTKAGLSRETLLGESGQVLSPPNGEKRGTVRFPAPVLGSDEWLFISQDQLSVGDRVSVIDVSGKSLIVKKT